MAQFNLTYDLNVTLKQRLGFEMAALIWSQYLTDDTNINLHISAVDSLNDAAAVGGAVPIFHEAHYGVYQAYLALDASSEADDSALGTLQEGNTVDVWLDEELVDGNSTLMLTRAQAKALGMDEALPLANGGAWTHDILQDPDALDGYILINNSYNWNYDLTREAETPEGELDFLTMALHELGHSLGFVSGLDGLIETFELHSGETRTEGFTPLDLLRYSDASATIENPDGAVSDLSLGAAAYFSLDGGVTALAEFEAGDKYQASHWQRFQSAIGIMDPTLGYQERTNISQLDLQAFDALGWDVNYSMLQDGLNLNALYDDALRAISQNFGVGVAAVESAVETGQDWYTLGYGQWWQAFKDQVVEMGYGQCWQEFEAEMLKIGYGSWWQAFDQDLLEMGYGGWWQAFEAKVLEMGYGGWWQEFEAQVLKDQIIEMGYGGWWQQFETQVLEMGYSSWWQALDSDLLEIGYGGWWQAFETQVLEMGYGSWWQEFKPQMLEIGYGGWWQKFEPQMLEMSYGGWWQVFEQQMLAMGYGGWWQEFEANLLEMGYGSWWQAFEAQVLEMGYGAWWQIFEEKILEMGYGSWWQQFEVALLEMGYGSWWQAFEMGYGSWWQQIEQHLEEVASLDNVTTIVDDDGHETVVSGSGEDDILAGSQGQDLIHGDAGDDLIDGKGGNDIILAGEGNDIAYGFAGEDVLFGGLGDDLLAGENGNDTLYGEAGDDILSGGRGDDFLDGGAGRDDVKGDSGDDVLAGGAGDDRLLGGSGADLLIGGEGLDFVNGGGDDDILYGDDFFSSAEADAPTVDPAVADLIGETNPTANLDFWLRLEVEDFRLNNYSPIQKAGASGSVVATQGKGKAIGQYHGPNGVYDLVIGYSDEADDVSDITVRIKKRGASDEDYTFQLNGGAGAGAYQISGVTLATGDRIELRGEADGADLAQLDYIDILTPGAAPTFDQNGAPINAHNLVGDRLDGTGIRLETEAMELAGGYAVLADPHASGGSVIGDTTGAIAAATATLTYSGESGIYNIFANYFDNSGGQAELNVLINGISLDRWTLDLEDDRTHERLLDLDVVLNTGDVIQIQGTANQGDQALIDYLRLEQGTDAALLYTNESGVMRVEAESMTLSGTYSIDNNSNSSSGAHLRTHKGNNLTADTTFTGETGLYDIVIGYYDRQDGVAQYTLSREGEQIDSWLADQGTSSYLRESLATHTLPSVVLNSGDSISIHAIKDGTDNGFLDYIEFAPTVTGATALDAAPVIQLDDVAPGIQLEAEALNLSYNAKIYNTSFASGGAYVMAVTSNDDDDDNDDQQGNYRATTLFEGGTGYYDIEVGYYDENDGEAELIVKVDNQEVDRWFADQDLGDNSANVATFTTRTVENVHVSSLDLIELIAVEDGGDRGNLDYIKFTQVSATTTTTGGGPTIQVEAEDLTLVGDYSVEARDGASGGQVIRTDANGVATLSFSGDEGLYDVVVHYVDEWDGSSSVALRVNGVEQENWLLDQTTSWFQDVYTSHTISGVSLSSSDFIEIAGAKNYFEHARIDYIEFVSVSPLNEANTLGDILRGGDGNDIAYGGDGDDQIYGDAGNDKLYGDYDTATASSSPPPPPATLTFQQGVDGYMGTVDTFVGGNDADISFDDATELDLDANSSSDTSHGLIRFDDIFGDQAGQITSADTINSAILEFEVGNSGDALEVYQMLQSWSDTVTWNQLGNGVQADGLEAGSAPITTTASVDSGLLQLDITSAVQNWQVNPDQNHGLALLPTDNNGVTLYTSESAYAPRLVVEVNQGNPSAAEPPAPIGGNDYLAGGAGNDILKGGDGDDILNGSNSIALGLNEQDVLVGGGGADQFILSEAAAAYYLGGSNDYAIIEDFELDIDTVHLFGSATDYTQAAQGADTLLYWQGTDLVAQFNGMTSLDLGNASFQFVV